MEFYKSVFGILPWWIWALIVVGLILITFLWIKIKTGRDRGGVDDVQRQRNISRRWGSPSDVRPLLMPQADPRRLPLGWLDGQRVGNEVGGSKLIVAPTQMRKTSTMVVPDSLEHFGPMVMTCAAKIDAILLTMKRRSEMGPVWVFDPRNTTGLAAARWSPIMGVRSWDDARMAGRWLTDAAHGDGRDSGLEGQKFWDAMSRRFMAPLVLLAARDLLTMGEVFAMVESGNENDILARLVKLNEQAAARSFRAHVNSPEKTKGSIQSTASEVLESWSYDAVTPSLNPYEGEGAVLDIDRLLDENGTLYVMSPAEDKEIFGPIYETLVNAVIRKVEERAVRTGKALDPRLLLCLEEAANIAPIRRLPELASIGAGQGFLTMSVWQSMAQIVRIYGPDRARELVDNHTAKIYMAGISDNHTLEQVSQMLGQTTIFQESISHDVGGYGQRRTNVSRNSFQTDLMPVNELREMPTDQVLAIVKNYPPMKLQVEGWYESEELRSMIDAGVAEMYDRQYAPAEPPKRRLLRRRGRKIAAEADSPTAETERPRDLSAA